MHVENHSIDVFLLLLFRNAAFYGFSFLKDLNLLIVKDPDANVIVVFEQDVSFVVEDAIGRQVYLPVGLDPLKVDLVELPDGPILWEVPQILSDLDRGVAIKQHALQNGRVTHDHVFRKG